MTKASDLLEAYKVPSEYYWVAEFRMTGTGKLDAKSLVQEAVPSRLQHTNDDLTEMESRIHTMACELSGASSIEMKASLEAIGLTSLQFAQLLDRINAELAMNITSQELLEQASLSELSRQFH